MFDWEVNVKKKQWKYMAFNKRSKIIFSFFVVSLVHLNVQAQESEGLTANASVSAGYDDNILRTTNKKSDKYIDLAPEIILNSLYGKHNFTATYQGDYTLYSENSELNYSQHDLNLRALFDHSVSFNSEFNVFYRRKIEEPGVNNSVLDESASEFEQFETKGASTRLYYGTRQSVGQFVLTLGMRNREYSDSLQAFRNSDSNTFTGTFFYNLGVKTRLLVETTFETFDYDSAPQNSDQSNDASKYFLGLEWQATNKTSGSLRVGYSEKNYDIEQFKTVSGLSYIVDFTWHPNTFTNVNISASKRPKESAEVDIGGFFSTTYIVGIEHELTPLVKITSSYLRSDDDISSVISRTDKRQVVQIGVNYSLRKWLDTGIQYRHMQRDSIVDSFNFKASIFELTFSSKFD